MLFAYKPKTKNTRWPFPTLHIWEGIQHYSNCGRVHKKKKGLRFFKKVPRSKLWTVCEHCTWGRPNLRHFLYLGGDRDGIDKRTD